jgi:hypothetical protein
MPTMTVKQPFHDGKLDDKKSVIAESKSTPLVIQLTRKSPVIPYLSASAPSEPTNTRRNAQEDWDLPFFPGESWFGG